MSDYELADDLFGGSEGGSPPPPPAAAVASGSQSRAATPLPTASGSRSPAKPATPPAEEGEDGGMDDLFGDEEEQASDATPQTPPSEGEEDERNPLEYDEQEEDPGQAEEDGERALLLIPKTQFMESSDGKVWHLKLPAYVNIESAPYDAEYYRATLEDREEYRHTDPAKANAKMVGVKNTVRWKWATGPDGEPIRQSNSRVIRWSDGSVSLQVGPEFFDISSSYGSTLARPQDPQPKLPPPNPNAAATYLSRPIQGLTVFMTEREIAGQLSLLPTSMNSRTHIELIKSAGNANVKASKMRNLDEIGDSKRVQELLLKSAGDGSGTPVKRPRRPAGSGAAKRGARRRKEVRYESGGSDVDSDGGGGGRSRRGRERDEGEYDEDDGFVVADDDDEEEEEEDEDTDEAEYGASRKKSKSKSKSKKSKKGRKREESLDEMEEAERRIEARERERKRARATKEKDGSKKKSREYVDTDEEEEDAEGEEDMDMDVESEED